MVHREKLKGWKPQVQRHCSLCRARDACVTWGEIIITECSFLTDLKNCIASTTQTIEQMYCDPLLRQVECKLMGK